MPRIRCLLLLLLAVAPAAAQPQYAVTVIGGLNPLPTSGPVSLPLALNNDGRVVGYAFTQNDGIRALNWKAGAVTPLGGVTGFSETVATRVNTLGRIAGIGYRLDPFGATVETHAVKWTGGVMTELGNFGGNHAAALAINDRDQIVGYATTPGDSRTRAFFYYGGVMTALNLFHGETEGYAYDISNTGYIVGTCVAGAPAKPFSWKSGKTRALPIPSWSRTGAANAVNNAGIAAGTYEINQYTGEFAACAWQGTKRTELGNLGGGTAYAIAADINTAGQIVGTSNSPAGYTGFVWVSGRMYDLRTLLVTGPLQITSANAINDMGQIAGAALINGRQTAILLSPVSADGN